MEMNGAQTWMVHVCGILLIAGADALHFHHRVYHWRRSGMSATWCSLLLMVLANLVYALGVGFLRPLAHNTPFSIFRV
jgi:uncharacterized membrane protein YecN with MAPEG domain